MEENYVANSGSRESQKQQYYCNVLSNAATVFAGFLCFLIGGKLISHGVNSGRYFPNRSVVEILLALPSFFIGALLVLYGTDTAPALFWWL